MKNILIAISLFLMIGTASADMVNSSNAAFDKNMFLNFKSEASHGRGYNKWNTDSYVWMFDRNSKHEKWFKHNTWASDSYVWMFDRSRKHNGWFKSKIPTPKVVPIPAAIWLFGSGLFGLFAMRKKLVNT